MRECDLNLSPGDLIWFLDVQTTGTRSAKDVITEVAWTIPNTIDYWTDFSVNESAYQESGAIKSSLVRPPESFQWPRSVERRLQEMSGMDLSCLKSAPTLSEVLNCLKSDLNFDSLGQTQSGPRPICVIHYARFEIGFLKQIKFFQDVEFPYICTYNWSRIHLSELPSKSLRSVAGWFGHATGEMKRAHSHLLATIAVTQGLSSLSGLVPVKFDSGQLSKIGQSELRKGRFKDPLKNRPMDLPHLPGVYRFIGPQESTLYIGKAVDLHARINSYFRGKKSKGARLHEMISQTKDVSFISIACPIRISLLESELIKKFDPPYNKLLRTRLRRVGWLGGAGGRLSDLFTQEASFQLGYPSRFGWIVYCQNLPIAQQAIHVLKAVWDLAEMPESPFNCESWLRAKIRFRDDFRISALGHDDPDPKIASLISFARRDRAARRRKQRLEFESSHKNTDSDLNESHDLELSIDELNQRAAKSVTDDDQAYLYIWQQIRLLFKLLLRSRRLTALMNSVVEFNGLEDSQVIEISGGQLVIPEDLAIESTDPILNEWLVARSRSISENTRSQQQVPMISALDTVSVLLGEMNRHVSNGGEITVHEKSTLCPDSIIVRRIWRTLGFLHVLRLPRIS